MWTCCFSWCTVDTWCWYESVCARFLDGAVQLWILCTVNSTTVIGLCTRRAVFTIDCLPHKSYSCKPKPPFRQKYKYNVAIFSSCGSHLGRHLENELVLEVRFQYIFVCFQWSSGVPKSVEKPFVAILLRLGGYVVGPALKKTCSATEKKT